MHIQLLGHPKSKVSRKAQRFFSERSVKVQYNDLRKRRPTPGELRKWIERFGVEAVVDPASRSYRDQGLAYLSASEESWLERMAGDPLLMRLPLVRYGRELAIGDDPEAWEHLARLAKGS